MGLLDFFKNFTKKNEEDNSSYNSTSTSAFNNAVYVNTRFLNWYSVGKHSSYPGWFQYECKIDDAKAKEEQMVKKGYLQHTKEFKGVTDCVLTDAGKSFIENNNEYLIADSFRKYDVRVQEYFEEKAQLPQNVSAEKILFSILDKKEKKHSKDKNFGMLRCVYLARAEYNERVKNFSESLKNYIFTARYDVSGLDNRDYNPNDLVIAPAVIKAIYKLRDYYDENMLTDCQKLYIPQGATSDKIFKQLINKILNNKDLPKKYSK